MNEELEPQLEQEQEEVQRIVSQVVEVLLVLKPLAECETQMRVHCEERQQERCYRVASVVVVAPHTPVVDAVAVVASEVAEKEFVDDVEEEQRLAAPVVVAVACHRPAAAGGAEEEFLVEGPIQQ